MAAGTRPRDHIRHIALPDPAVDANPVHVQATRECRVVEVYLLRSDPTPQMILWHHEDSTDTAEELQANERGVKNSWTSQFKMVGDLPYRIRKDDTIGFFKNSLNGAATTLVVKEITDPALDVNSGVPGSPFPSAQI